MKNFLLIIFITTSSFCHTIYLETSLTNNAKINESDYDLKTSNRIGYNTNVWKNTNISVAIGLDFAIEPITFKDIDIALNTFSLYAVPKYSISKYIGFWCSLGFAFSNSEQIDDNDTILKDGPVYGLGLTYNINKKIGINLGYFVEDYSIETTYLQNAYAIVEKNSFEIMRSSLQLAYSF